MQLKHQTITPAQFFPTGQKWIHAALWSFILILFTIYASRYPAGMDWEASWLITIRGSGNPAMTQLALLFSWLGDKTGVVLMWFLALLICWRRGDLRAGAWVTAALAGEFIFYSALKAFVSRPRPEIIRHLIEAEGSAFPSGHAGIALVFFVTLAFLEIQRRNSLGHEVNFAAAYTLAAIPILLISISRLYLGVHWPSDVLGGFATGAVWLSLLFLLYHKPIARRR